MDTGVYPLVSIITPSFNQGKFIRETIESVLAQDYPNIEHIVVDGGSTDETLAILNHYSVLGDRFRFVSEPDRGQAHAVNKGLRMARGDIIGWLNSDDTYWPGAVSKAVHALMQHPDWGMVYGRAYYTDENNRVLSPYPVESFNPRRLFEACIICQPAAFIRKHVFEALGGVDETLFFCMDYELWMRIAKQVPVGDIQDVLANSRLHAASKTSAHMADKGFSEIFQTSLKHYGEISNYWVTGYIHDHFHQGASWILNQLKPYRVFGNTPQIQSMNRYEDLWVPPHFRIAIQSAPRFPLRALLIKGRHVIQAHGLVCSIYINGIFSQNKFIKHHSFMLEIPVPANHPYCVVDVITRKYVIPARNGSSSDTRALSYLVDEAIPLSEKEYACYQALGRGMQYAAKWLIQHRRTAPVGKIR